MWIKGNKFKLTEVWLGHIVISSCGETGYGFSDLSKPGNWGYCICAADEYDVRVMYSKGQIHAK